MPHLHESRENRARGSTLRCQCRAKGSLLLFHKRKDSVARLLRTSAHYCASTVLCILLSAMPRPQRGGCGVASLPEPGKHNPLSCTTCTGAALCNSQTHDRERGEWEAADSVSARNVKSAFPINGEYHARMNAVHNAVRKCSARDPFIMRSGDRGDQRAVCHEDGAPADEMTAPMRRIRGNGPLSCSRLIS